MVASFQLGCRWHTGDWAYTHGAQHGHCVANEPFNDCPGAQPVGKLRHSPTSHGSHDPIAIARSLSPTPADVARHDHVVRLVEPMLALHKARQSTRTPHKQTVLAAQVAATACQLDRLVYALYGLTEAEVWIVEGE